MAFTLPDNSTVEYNGIRLTQYPIKTEVRPEVVYDDANRMVKWVKYTIYVSGMIYLAPGQGNPNPTTDTTVGSLRQALQTPGKQLKFEQKGFNPISVNAPGGSVKDVNWGPKPTLKHLVTYGNGQAVRFEWECVVCIPECGDSAYQKALAAATYKVAHDYDDQGLVTVTITGAIEIALTFGPNQTLPDNVDNYWEKVYFPVQNGFQRVSRKKDISADRRRLEYTFVDKQIPVPLPENLTLADIRHRISSLNEGGHINFRRWRHHITATLRTKPTVPKSQALVEFMFFVNCRVTRALDPATNGGDRVTWIPQQVDFEEEVFGLTSYFTYSYDVLISDLIYLLNNSGLWRPVAAPNGTAWTFDSWRKSLEQDVNAARGILKLKYKSSDDTLIDLCVKNADPEPAEGRGSPPGVLGPPPDSQVTGGTAYLSDGKSTNLPSPRPTGFPTGNLTLDLIFPGIQLPPPFLSFFDYYCEIGLEQDNHLTVLKPLAGDNKPTRRPVDALNLLQIATNTTVQGPGIKSTVPDILQRMTAPTATVSLTGHMIRIGYRPFAPCLTKFQGQDLTGCEAQRQTAEAYLGSCGGLPIFGLGWHIVYRLPRPIQDASPATPMPVPANPNAMPVQSTGSTGGA